MIDEKKLINFINSREFQMRFIRSPKSVQEVLLEFIQEQPKIDEWILFSEKLPHDGQKVIVSKFGKTLEEICEFLFQKKTSKMTKLRDF